MYKIFYRLNKFQKHQCVLTYLPHEMHQSSALNSSNRMLLLHYSNSKRERSSIISTDSTNEKTSLQTSVKTITETTKTLSYLGVVIVGFGIGGMVIYAIFNELFSSKSPNSVYSKAFKYVSKNSRIITVLGDNIKGFGEETRRGRRQHISHAAFNRDGVNCLRMKFYIKGNSGSGTVHLEMAENEKGKYVYRYLFVIIDGLYQEVITLEDNREALDKLTQKPTSLEELNFNDSLNLSK